MIIIRGREEKLECAKGKRRECESFCLSEGKKKGRRKKAKLKRSTRGRKEEERKSG